MRQERVALKQLAYGDDQGIYRLKQEFRALQELSHPNVICLHELFADGDRWFFTMQLIEGEPFQRWARSGAGGECELNEQRLRAALFVGGTNH